ncbi:MAG: LptF/LptG family permease [Planctomycetota bacterium]
MKTLDRYVLRVFLGTFGLVFLFVMGIFVVLNIFSKIDSLLEAREVLAANGWSVIGVLAHNYLVSLPFLFLRISPFICIIAATIAFIRLMRGNEITPMIAAGRSLSRITLPVHVFVGVMVLGMLALQEWAVPRLAHAWSYSEKLIKGNVDGLVDGLGAIGDGYGNIWSIERYYPHRRRMEGVNVIRFRHPGEGQVAGSLSVETAVWRDDGAGWFPKGAVLKPVGHRNPKVLPENEPLPTDLRPPRLDLEVAKESREAERMLSLTEAARIARRHPDVPRRTVAFHTLLTNPLSALLLLLVGLPVVLRFRERSLFVGVGIALAFCAIWFAMDTVFRDLGGRAQIVPEVATWLPVAVFLALAAAVHDSGS